MTNRKFGSLFESILGKSPDTAKKLTGIPSRIQSKTDEVLGQESIGGFEAEGTNDDSHTKRNKGKSNVDNMRCKNEGDSSCMENVHNSQELSPLDSARYFAKIPENACQFSNEARSQNLDIVIGLDFGTSSTKVILHAPSYAGNPAFAVPFDKFAHPNLKYLLPTRITENEQKWTLSLYNEPAKFSDFKVHLLRNPKQPLTSVDGSTSSATAIIAATIYLALVIRYARSWFLEYKKSIFGNFEINWEINLGLPAAIDDNPELRETFEIVGKAAWLLSLKSGFLTLDQAYRATEDVRYSRFAEEIMPEFSLVPEVIAEVIGYTRSQSRDEGLHFLVDIGASTFDVCAFSLVEKGGDDHFPIFSADVEFLGAQSLHNTRVQAAVNATSDSIKGAFGDHDPLDGIPDEISAYIPNINTIEEYVKSANTEFEKKCGRSIRKIIWHTRKHKDPISPRWVEELPIFLCGGARSMRIYSDVVKGIEEWLSEYISSCKGIRIVPLPKPLSLDADVQDDEYHRLAVAWGLSHQNFNIGTYDRPSEIDDIPQRKIRNFSDKFVSKDMV